MKNKIYRFIAVFTVINLFVEIFFPAISYALTSGPTQPEHVQFSPIGADNNVNLFSGDFSYNIPLFELPGPDGGYPFNLTYQAGIGVDDEASWVGLGWNLTPGAINRQMRGLPDEFTGEGDQKDQIIQELHRRANITESAALGADLNIELSGTERRGKNEGNTYENALGGLGVGLTMTFRNNSYTGVGYALTPSVSHGLPQVAKALNNKFSLGLGLSATLDSETGADIGLSVSARPQVEVGGSSENNTTSSESSESQRLGQVFQSSKSTVSTSRAYTTAGINLGAKFSYNSRKGLTGIHFDVGLNGGRKYTKQVANISNTTITNMTGDVIGGGSSAAIVGGSVSSVGISFGTGWSLNFNNNGYMPSLGIPMRVHTLAGVFKTGLDLGGGFFLSPTLSYSRTEQQVRYASRNVPAYGYLNTHKNSNNNGLMDFNREREGAIFPNTKALPSPHFTYDTYMVTGQGMMGMFRPYRSEVMTLGDRKESSITDSYSGGIDIGITVKHFGGNFEEVTGKSTSERLQLPGYSYVPSSNNPTYEPVFYKFQGEASIISADALSNIGGNTPLKFKLDKRGKPTRLEYSKVEAALEEAESNKEGGIEDAIDATKSKETETGIEPVDALAGQKANLKNIIYPERVARNRTIIPIENRYADALPEYTVHYKENNPDRPTYDGTPDCECQEDCNCCEEEDCNCCEEQEYIKLKRKYKETDPLNFPYKEHHLAGFTCTSTSGMRYIYGLPVYNFEQREVVKSIETSGNQSDTSYESGYIGSNDEDLGRNADDTEEFESIVTTPPYAASYLLTNILGNDYVDVDPNTNPGPSQKDLGYWVKYYYERVSTTVNDEYRKNYNWRMPYEGANFTEGINNTDFDDKISYIEGKKELFFLDKVETKTHVAIFISNENERYDGLPAKHDDNNTDNPTPNIRQRSLDRIDIYSKSDPSKPLKSVHFKYDYSLCQGTPNSVGTNSGKLTLKKVYFTYRGIDRGGINPYEFEYNEDKTFGWGLPFGYSENVDHVQDAWGTYAGSLGGSLNSNGLNNTQYPFVRQDIDKEGRDQYAAAWSLSKIIFPSGSQMRIYYESDDYAYVQDRKAMQMTKFVLPGERDEITDDDRRIFFALDSYHQNILDNTVPNEEIQLDVVNQYLDDRDQVYFKSVIALRDEYFEEVDTYINIEPTKKTDGDNEVYTRGIVKMSVGTGDEKLYGFFTVLPAVQKKKEYHPLSAATWIKLRNEHPRLLNSENNMEDYGTSLGDAFNFGKFYKSLSGIYSLGEVFRNYFVSMNKREWGRKIKPERSFIRLQNVTGRKYGGGIRVKRIEFSEDDDRSAENTYGQVYEYTTTDENGREISSGVASYEPSRAGEENPLRYVEGFSSTKVPLMPTVPMFSEFPVNEGYYPSASVGYSKVTVKSIATAAKIARIEQNEESFEGLNFPSGISTTGVIVNEFYTYKDFPIIAVRGQVQFESKTDLSISTGGANTISKSGASQGFVIELNNMHGIPKSTVHYGQNDEGRVIYDKPISSVSYSYKTTRRNGKQAVENLCPVLAKEKNGSVKKINKLIGVEYEVFMDANKNYTSTNQWGLNANIDFLASSGTLPFTFGLGGFLKEMEEEVNSVVVNKIIYRSGILESVTASDGLSVSRTENLLWDQYTGGVLLNSVNNNFDDKIYSYTIPAYTQYEQMGGAYKNIGMKFTTTLSSYQDGGRMYNTTTSIPRGYTWANELVEGDELIVSETEDNPKTSRAIYMGKDKQTGNLKFYVVPIAPNTDTGNPLVLTGRLNFVVYRSGRRNLLSTSAGSITALSDPTEEYSREKKTFSGKTIIKKK